MPTYSKQEQLLMQQYQPSDNEVLELGPEDFMSGSEEYEVGMSSGSSSGSESISDRSSDDNGHDMSDTNGSDWTEVSDMSDSTDSTIIPITKHKSATKSSTTRGAREVIASVETPSSKSSSKTNSLTSSTSSSTTSATFGIQTVIQHLQNKEMYDRRPTNQSARHMLIS
jgi:hypothetical protein